jgi:hypothetical protein
MLVRTLLVGLIFSSSTFASVNHREAIYEKIMPEYKAYAYCTAKSAKTFKINEIYLLAVMLQERGPAIGKLTTNNGSYDHGVTGINTVRAKEVEKIGLTLSKIENNPCYAIFAAAYLLSEEIKAAPSVLTGIANYHYDEKGKYPHNHYRYKSDIAKKIKKITSIILN